LEYEIITYESPNKHIKKFVFKCSKDQASFETSSFFVEDQNIHDICVSTMAGCYLGCLICSNTYSELPFQRILSAEEIIFQVDLAIKKRNDINQKTRLRIGYMGNGEPLLNFTNTIKSINYFINIKLYPLNQIAISTIGINIHHLKKLLNYGNNNKPGIKLQLSLYSMNEKIRRQLLPSAPDISTIINYLDEYAIGSGIPVRYNYPLIKNLNDSEEQLNKLKDFLLENKDLRRIKFSAYNPFPGVGYEPLTDHKIITISEWFENQGISVDRFFGDRESTFYASCGQMRSVVLNK